MEEIDIEFLLKKNKWISVYPSDNIWKACIYKKLKNKKWILEHSKKYKSPKECWDWLEKKFSNNYIEKH